MPDDTDARWLDPSRPVAARVADLLARMTPEEKRAQLVGLWVSLDTERGEVAPFQNQFLPGGEEEVALEDRLEHGLGQLTRAFGSVPVEPTAGARLVDDLQRRLVEDTRLGIPAIVHEECLTGFMTWGATTFPSPLNWGSTWDPDLIERVGDTIRSQMRSVGAHQGLAPVLDVVRDPRWGRVEECIGEDPYLVGAVGSAYVRGLEGDDPATGVVATLKHFAGYSASEGGHNLAPAHLGPREMADVFLVPFEMALRHGGARSVMNAYQDNDGVPAAASAELLTATLRDRWGFEGIVVADYFAVTFLHALHGVTAGPSQSAAAALHAGIDVELPNPDCYAGPLGEAMAAGEVDAAVLDRAVARVLGVKFGLGLFEQPYVDPPAEIDLDPPGARALALTVAERSLVLLKNDGTLPLPAQGGAVAVIGPNADHAPALLGNYTFQNHVAFRHPGHPPGVAVATVLEEVRRAAGPKTRVLHAVGCQPTGDDDSGFREALLIARRADVAVVVVGDRAGHFGTGTVGEGTDTDDLSLPGVQQQLVEAVVSSGTPTVVVLVNGRPFALPWLAEHAAAVVEAWFPGEEGAAAVAGLLFGTVEPGGRVPVTFSRGAGQQPAHYNAKKLGRAGYANATTRPVYPFGHGLSYTTFGYADLAVEPAEVPVDGVTAVSCTVRNTGGRAGEEVVQLYVHDPVATVTRPAQELKGFARVALAPGEASRVRFELQADLLSFTGVDLRRVVEPGAVEVMVGSSSADIRLTGGFTLTGPPRVVGEGRVLTTPVRVEPLT